MTISDQAKAEVRTVLQPGEVAVDTTMGNGWDTVFLAEKVGSEGRVYAFDVQRLALEATAKRLKKAELFERCSLFEQGHEEMCQVVPNGVGAVMFNLGYLPYANREVVTNEETTLRALEGAVGLLRRGGVLTVICYRGHAGGMEEAAAVLAWARQQREDFEVTGPESMPPGDQAFLLTLLKKSTA